MNKQKSYETITDVIHHIPDLQKVQLRQEPIKEDINSPIAQFLHLAIFLPLQKCRYKCGPQEGSEVPYVLPLEFFLLPGSEDPNQHKNLATDDRLLSLMVLELERYPTSQMFRECAEREGSYTTEDFYQYNALPFEDEITKALISVLFEDGIGVWVVFACRILLDINSILKDKVDEPYLELR
jgi:hypothetical protein